MVEVDNVNSRQHVPSPQVDVTYQAAQSLDYLAARFPTGRSKFILCRRFSDTQDNLCSAHVAGIPKLHLLSVIVRRIKHRGFSPRINLIRPKPRSTRSHYVWRLQAQRATIVMKEPVRYRSSMLFFSNVDHACSMSILRFW